jgi:hypothetical protein
LQIDRKAPVITIATNFEKAVEVSPVISGFIEDENVLPRLDYSLDNGLTWLTLENISTGSATKKQFALQIPPLDDGNYPLLFRATDGALNISAPISKLLIIDRLPPVVGAVIVKSGLIAYEPKDSDNWNMTKDTNYTVYASVIGGPTDVQGLAIDPVTGISIDIKFTKKYGSLWSSTFSIKNPGTYGFTIHALDGAGNTGDADVGIFNVGMPGMILDSTGNPIKNAKLTIYTLNPDSNRFEKWDAGAYGSINPIPVYDDGSYTLVLPQGSFMIEVGAYGFRSIHSQIITISEPVSIVHSITLAPLPKIQLGPVNFYLPQFSIPTRDFPIQTSDDNATDGVKNNIFEFPNISGADNDYHITTESFRGKKSMLCLLNTWLPQTTSQITQILEFHKVNPDVQVVAVFPQEPQTTIDVFKKRGGYQFTSVADSDGKSIKSFSYHAAPMFFAITPDGKIKRKKVGMQLSTQLTKMFDNDTVK